MKTALILAAAATLLAASMPVAMAKGPTDMEVFCKIWPLSAKCHSAGTPTPAKMIAPMHTAMAAPKPMSAPHIKMLTCTKSTSGKYLLDCAWK